MDTRGGGGKFFAAQANHLEFSANKEALGEIDMEPDGAFQSGAGTSII